VPFLSAPVSIYSLLLGAVTLIQYPGWELSLIVTARVLPTWIVLSALMYNLIEITSSPSVIASSLIVWLKVKVLLVIVPEPVVVSARLKSSSDTPVPLNAQ